MDYQKFKSYFPALIAIDNYLMNEFLLSLPNVCFLRCLLLVSSEIFFRFILRDDFS